MTDLVTDDSRNDSSGGIGVVIACSNELDWHIQRVIPGSPAEQAGLAIYDQIIAINGLSLKNLSVEQISKRLRGPIQTKVILDVKSVGLQNCRSVTVMRSTLPLAERNSSLDRMGAAFKAA